MICPRCGAENPDNAPYCNLCATPFAPVPQQAPAPQGQAPTPPAAYAQPLDPFAASHVPAASDVYGDRAAPARATGHHHHSRGLGKQGTTIMALVVVAVVVAGGVILYLQLNKSAVSGKYMETGSTTAYTQLNSDGTFSVTDQGQTISGTYKVDGTSITLTPTRPAGLPTSSGTIQGDTLTDPDGVKWVKQK